MGLELIHYLSLGKICEVWKLRNCLMRFCIHYRTFGGSFLLHVPYSHGIAPSNSASTEISIRAWDWKAVNDSSRLNVVYCSNFQIQIQIHLHTTMILFPFLNCILRTCASLHLLSFSFCLGVPWDGHGWYANWLGTLKHVFVYTLGL